MELSGNQRFQHFEKLITVVILGSYHRFWNEIREANEEFHKYNEIIVTAPLGKVILNPDAAFPISERDKIREPWRVERRLLELICYATGIYIFNKDGYIGAGTAMEIGGLAMLGTVINPFFLNQKRVFLKEPCKNPRLNGLLGFPWHAQVRTPKEAANELVESGLGHRGVTIILEEG